MWRNHLPFESSSLLSRGGSGGFEKEEGAGREGKETERLGQDYFFLIFAICSCIGYLPNANAENDPVGAKPMMLFFASDSSLPEEVNYKQVFRLTIQDSS
jgi:hypothetical protein